MKVTIELTEAEVKGLKEYLKDTSGNNEKVTKKDIEAEIRGIVYGTFQQPHNAIYDYISKYEN